MLCCAASFVIAAYPKVRLILQDLRALPANILQSRPQLDFYVGINVDGFVKTGSCCDATNPKIRPLRRSDQITPA
jgi:hypothetical protein